MKTRPSYFDLSPILLLLGVMTGCHPQQSLRPSIPADTVLTSSILDYDIYFDNERFFIKTVESGLKLKIASEVALGRTTSDSIRSLASNWKKSHEAGIQKITDVGREMNMVLPQEMNRMDAQQIADLVTQYSAEFDNRFIKMIIEDYERCIPLFEQAALDATHGNVRRVASALLPQLYEQLAQARIIAKVSFKNR
jgi:predicted outer membrane protein